jgi:peptidoglycan hydrolase FlgJ
MQIQPLSSARSAVGLNASQSLASSQGLSAAGALANAKGPAGGDKSQDPSSGELRKTFDSFVGETFYGQMLSSMRKTVGKAAYFDGGRAEEIFRGQLDQVISQKLTEASAGTFSGPMFDLFALQRK